FSGARALPFVATRPTSFPSGVNSSTYPSPPPRTASRFAVSCCAYVTKTFPFSAWMPNGAQPCGMPASLNPSDNGLNDASNASTRALWKSASYRRSVAVARPVFSAPAVELSTATTAAVPFTVGDQPSSCPPSVSNRNRAEPLTPFWLITKSAALLLATVPVGPPGTVTVRAVFEPTPEYNVDVFVLLFAVHHGDVADALSPQAFTSDVSVSGALTVGPSETSVVRLYATSVPAASAPAAPGTSPAATPARTTSVVRR